MGTPRGQLLVPPPPGHLGWALMNCNPTGKGKKKKKDQNSIFVSLYLYMLSMALCDQLLSVLGLH